jgi:hypothetical protein
MGQMDAPDAGKHSPIFSRTYRLYRPWGDETKGWTTEGCEYTGPPKSKGTIEVDVKDFFLVRQIN